ncbi:GNAT family N-acetyltransferase [Couchioplanes caeruleus]|uniref:GCN5 acetyltransferase n=2 Tax=Couchioplanes caeruleus TaxID=56438 RepID=A0A1K0GVY9_9ACTN|nr:GNAT family N-acetyltransferase [Couchioplanes caeruleus]OJF15548.1 GCN5 acetyltransferase [Couchioplanes caeruleus subsp. caeruleus]ROP30314.1 FR47-like protein [Couchioplanes caeruleus]
MNWHITGDVQQFLSATGAFLRARPVQNTLPLTTAEHVRLHGPRAYGPEDAVFGWHDGGEAAVVWTPPRPPVLSPMSPGVAAELAEVLGDDLPGVSGPVAAVEAFVAAWERRTGTTAKVHSRMRLFRLGTLVPPTPPASGSARVADAGDRDLLVGWTAAFFREVGEDDPAIEAFVDDRLSYGGMLLWEDGGTPVSMAALTRPEAGMVRVQAVYTPREHRTRGYAGAVTTAISRAARQAGATEVALFTDLDNPTSNALYQRLGYEPLEDRTVVEFSS